MNIELLFEKITTYLREVYNPSLNITEGPQALYVRIGEPYLVNVTIRPIRSEPVIIIWATKERELTEAQACVIFYQQIITHGLVIERWINEWKKEQC